MVNFIRVGKHIFNMARVQQVSIDTRDGVVAILEFGPAAESIVYLSGDEAEVLIEWLDGHSDDLGPFQKVGPEAESLPNKIPQGLPDDVGYTLAGDSVDPV